MNPSIESTMQFIADFGIMICICAIFLYVVLRIINLVFKHVEGKIGTKKHDELLELRNSINQEVQSLLDIFLEDHHGDRIQVIEFSNSVMSVAYLPFKYMTCTYEVYKPGAPQMGSRIDHLSTSLFTTFFSYLHEHPYCILDGNTTEHISGGAMNDLLITSGEPKALCTLIESARGKSLGYVIMKKSEGFTGDDIEDIQYLSDQISALLSVADK